jgi:hypothetical protein
MEPNSMKRRHAGAGPAVAVAIVVLAGLIATQAAAGAEPPPLPAVPSYSDVLACRSLPDPKQRLACFDKTVGTLAAAETSGDVVVINRAKVEEVKRQAFGLPNLDALKAFEIHTQAKPVEKISFVIASAHQNAAGRWMVTSADGQVWVQIDSSDVYPEPAAGRTAVVSRGMIGSFFLKVGTDSAFRVRREQ